MSNLCRLYSRLMLRNLIRERLRTAVTLLGLMLGVALIVAIRLGNAGALASFREAAKSLAGRADLRIQGPAGWLDEKLFPELSWLQKFGKIAPVVQANAYFDPQQQSSAIKNRQLEKATEHLQILGVDMLADSAIRDYDLLDTGPTDSDRSKNLFRLLIEPNSIVLTTRFAKRVGLNVNDSITLQIGPRKQELFIRGLLKDTGPAKAWQGQFALMDIASAQQAFNKLGKLDAIDLTLHEGINREIAQQSIAKKLPAGLMISTPNDQTTRVETMIAAFHFNLNALASVAVIVGLFLVYNTLSMAVTARQQEIGMLKAVGASPGQIQFLFLIHAQLLSMLGTAFGLGIGRLLGWVAVSLTAQTVNTFYLASAASRAVTAGSLSFWEIVFAFLLTMILGLAAGWVPARQAALSPPIKVARPNVTRTPMLSWLAPVAMAVILGMIGGVFCQLPAIGGLPIFGFLGQLCLLLSIPFVVPILLVSGAKLFVLMGRHVGKIGPSLRLAGHQLHAIVSRISISVAGLAMALAMAVAVTIMVESFRSTLSYWVDQSLRADIYIRVDQPSRQGQSTPLPKKVIDSFLHDQDVAGATVLQFHTLPFEQATISIRSIDFADLRDFGKLLFKNPSDRDPLMDGSALHPVDPDSTQFTYDPVLVSESFSLRHRKGLNDKIVLMTKNGPLPFLIQGVYYDYSTTQGALYMDDKVYKKYFATDEPSHMALYLKPSADVQIVRNRLANTIDNRQDIMIKTNADLRSQVQQIFNSTFAITDALQIIAVAVSGLGVISTLWTLVRERRRELAIISSVGASPAQIRGILVAEAFIIGLAGVVAALFFGTLMSMVLIYVINVQSFGWTIQFRWPIGVLMTLSIGVVLMSVLASVVPARSVTKDASISYLREE